MAQMRLDKYLAACGCGSRLECKALVKYGHVTVDGEVAARSDQKIEESARVEVDGELLRYQQFVYVLMNKPADVLSATYDKYQTTVIDLLQGEYAHRALAPVGRLDIDTTGLLLLSDDGALAHFLLSPKRHVPKVYEAQLNAPVTQEMVEAFAKGIELSDFTAQSALLEPLAGNRGRVVLQEGKFHQVKRMFQAVGLEVTALRRTAFGPLQLEAELQEGQFRELREEEIIALRAAVQAG